MKTCQSTLRRLCSKLASATGLSILLLATIQADAGKSDYRGSFTRKAPSFLEQIKPTFTLSKADPKQQSACRGARQGECVTLLTYGGNSNGGIPTIDPSFEANTPNARVDMVLQRVQISGHPMEPQDLYENLIWTTKVDSVTEHTSEQSGYYLDGSTDVTDTGHLHNPVVIHSALILNGCNNFQTLTMAHTGYFSAGPNTQAFEGEDSTTLDSTGFYNFSYSILVDSAENGTFSSSLDLSGKVNVTCTAQSAL